MKHTEGKLSISRMEPNNLTNEGGLPLIIYDEQGEFVARICVVDSQDGSIKRKDLWRSPDEERQANAEHICKAWNSHDELVEALKKLLDDYVDMGKFPEQRNINYDIVDSTIEVLKSAQ